MPFLRGRVSFARLGVGGSSPAVDEGLLEKLAEQEVKPSDIGFAKEVDAGWCAGGHVYDAVYAREKNVFFGGEAAHVGMRVDVNRVPGEIKRAIKGQHEDAARAESATGELSRAERREAKELAEQALHTELASGRYRRSAMTGVLYDAERSVVLSASGGSTTIEQLGALWRNTFDGASHLELQSAGALAHAHLARQGRERDFEDLMPSAFTEPPAWVERETRPDVPWAMGGPEPHDFLGNEFLLWLWHAWEEGEGVVHAEFGSGRRAEVDIALDGPVELRCAWGATGSASLKGEEGGASPMRIGEAGEALASGKWPRKATLLIASGGRGWRLGLQADKWLVSGCVLPEPPEEMDDPREIEEWRIGAVRELDALLVGMYAAFLDIRAGEGWGQVKNELRRWIASRRPGRGAAVMVEGKGEGVAA
jgi:hypothetical protein